MRFCREMSDEAWNLASGDRSVSVRVRSRFRANNPEAVADAALAGLGIALLPRYVCEADLAAPDRMRFTRNQSFLNYLRNRLG